MSWPVFGTATLPTGTSEPSPRGEVFFWPVLSTATLPTSTSEPSPRDKGGLLTGLRRRHPAYRCLSGILAWQRGLLASLRHGTPAYRHLSGILAWLSVLLTGLWHGNPAYKYLRAIPAWQGGGGFWTVFGTATLPTSTSEPSPRGHCELVYRIVALLCFMKFTWHEPLLIIK